MTPLAVSIVNEILVINYMYEYNVGTGDELVTRILHDVALTLSCLYGLESRLGGPMTSKHTETEIDPLNRVSISITRVLWYINDPSHTYTACS